MKSFNTLPACYRGKRNFPRKVIDMPKVQEASSARQEERSETPAAPTFPHLLERAGFRIRGRRADCPNCEGHSRLTVSFTNEVAYCHRCHWTANVRALSRALGARFIPETREAREKRDRAAQFSEWMNTLYLILSRRLRLLTRRAELAKNVLNAYPDCEPAWSALAELYHNEVELFAALDQLACEKVSRWLGSPVTRQQLLAAFEDAFQRVDLGMSDAA